MLNVRQRRFALNIFQGMSQREAYIDAYNPTGAVETIDANASALVSNSKVAHRVEELLGSVENSAVATIQERKEILTGIIRADLTDYIKEGEPVLNNESLNTGAVSSYSVITSLQGQVTRRIKLRDPIAATSELNKMESVGGVGHVTVNDNRSVTINVMDEATRDRVLRIASRTRKIESTGTGVMSSSKLIDTVVIPDEEKKEEETNGSDTDE